MRKILIALFIFILLFWKLAQFQQERILFCQNSQGGLPKPSCIWPLKNPRSLLDQKWGLRKSSKTVLKKKTPVHSVEFQNGWIKALFFKTTPAPIIFGFQKAIWTGDLSSLPFWLVEKYRERGLLPVLALSGQHIWALLLCIDVFIFWGWRAWGSSRGNLLWKIKEWKVPLMTAWLFSLASNEPSMIRTAISAGGAFIVRKIPLELETGFVFLVSVMFFLMIDPEQLSSPGFVLSAWGILGICLVNRCFEPQQIFLKGVWLWFWIAPLVAGFFGVSLERGFYFTWALSLIWEQMLLPLLFALGIALVFLPMPLSFWLSDKAESLVNFWLKLESSHTESYTVFVFRPRPTEIGVFALWLIALACWNRRVWLRSQKNVSTARHPLL